MNAHWTDQLSAYLDGELEAGERAACEAHLAACASCRETLDDLRALVTEAGALGLLLPPGDPWPAIEGRIVTGRRARAARRISFSLPELALAASLLIAVSAGSAWLAFSRGTAAAPVSRETPIRAVSDAAPATNDVRLANFADAQYDAAVADLERILLEERGRLDPRTVLVLERNLRTIDEAIGQAREALASDPSNTFLNSHLADARQRKLDLLRRATELAGN
ncbi:MAG: anti-sigma factor [Vicinamibacterales bacterium]